MQDLSGKSVLVVGGTNGIGLAVAKGAVSRGAHVSIAGRSEAGLKAAVDEIGGVDTLRVDATDATSIDAFAKALPPVDHVVLTVSTSAAGLGVTVDMAQMPIDAAQKFLMGKFWAQYRLAQAALPKIAQGGSLTFTSGAATRKSLPGHTIVAANNAAIEGAARQLAKEIAPIRVNTISPGLTATRAYDHMSDEARAGFFEHVTAGQPINRPGTPEEVAHAYLFAMTSTYLTGVVIDVDGGFLVQ